MRGTEGTTMRDYEELVKSLRENAEWAEGNIWEVPIMLPDNLKQAADAIEELIMQQIGTEQAVKVMQMEIDRLLASRTPKEEK